jgi:hypothetical protein
MTNNNAPDYSPDADQREEMARELMAEVENAFHDGEYSDIDDTYLDVRVMVRVPAGDPDLTTACWWLAVGDASYDTAHGHACGASYAPIVRHLSMTDALDIIDDCVAQCLDAIAQ